MERFETPLAIVKIPAKVAATFSNAYMLKWLLYMHESRLAWKVSGP